MISGQEVKPMVKDLWKRLWRRVVGISLVAGVVGVVVSLWLWGVRTTIAIAIGVVVGLANQFILGTSLRTVSERPDHSKSTVLMGTFGRGALVGVGTLAVALGLGPMKALAFLAALLGVQIVTVIVTALFQTKDPVKGPANGTSGGPDGGEQRA